MVVKESKDVEMKDASSVDAVKSTEETKKEEEKKDPELLTLEGNQCIDLYCYFLN